jgi:hypothetical protein
MLCFQCGQELLNAARFCAKCGSPASTAAFPSTASDAAVPSQDDAVNKKPYRWGRFQGWFLIFVPPLIALWCFVVTLAGTEDDYGYALVAALTSVLTVPTGIGILKKRRYGLILVYVTLGLTCALILIGFAMGGVDAARDAAVGGPFWIACTIYYHKRKAEFT